MTGSPGRGASPAATRIESQRVHRSIGVTAAVVFVGMTVVMAAEPELEPVDPAASKTISGTGVKDRSGEDLDFLRIQSCASSTCHGGVEDRGPKWNHSIATWNRRDPHATAGEILRRDAPTASADIVRRLAPAAATDDAVYRQVLRTRCISCHTSATATHVDDPSIAPEAFESVVSGGVSCQSCHGPASAWLSAHLSVAFDGGSDAAAGMGFVNLEDPATRAEQCVGCHVGSRTRDGVVRDMNHDLIAAGHPPLRFDLLTFDANQPKHWDVQTRTARPAVQRRRIGRQVARIQAATLAAQRATDHTRSPDVPFPELSDHDCFACHARLSIGDYDIRGLDDDRDLPTVSRGIPGWNAWQWTRWHTGGSRSSDDHVAPPIPGRSSPEEAVAFAAARRRDAVAELARVQTTADDTASTATQLSRLAERLADDPPRDWNEAADVHLDLRAISIDASPPTAKTLADVVRRSEEALRFSAAADLPPGRGPLDSPDGFDAAEWARALSKSIRSSAASSAALPDASTP